MKEKSKHFFINLYEKAKVQKIKVKGGDINEGNQ